jgi:hypothetical protein
MSRRQYRRNGTPIGKYSVYALAIKSGKYTKVYEIVPQGIKTYEDLEMLVTMEELSGKFGHGYDRLAITKPGVDLRGVNLYGVDISYADLRGADLRCCTLSEADITGTDLRGANLEYATRTNEPIPDGWESDYAGVLVRR